MLCAVEDVFNRSRHSAELVQHPANVSTHRLRRLRQPLDRSGCTGCHVGYATLHCGRQQTACQPESDDNKARR